MSIPDLSKFSEEDLRIFLNSFDTVLTDCDGVLWIIGEPLDGARDAFAALEALGKRVFFVSNNATRTVAHYVSTLGALGYKVTESQVVTPAVSAAHLLRSRGVDRKVHVVASGAFRSDLEAAGVRCTQLTAPASMTIEDIKSHLRNLDSEVGAFVLDFTASLTYVQMLEASVFLSRPDCLFVVGATDFDVPVASGITFLGPGYFVEMLKKSSGREPLVVGKPSVTVRDVVMERHPTLDPSRTLFIGDSLQQDIGQGVLSGFITLLVLSGISTLEEAEKAPPAWKPQFVAPSLKNLAPSLQHIAKCHCQPNEH